MKSADTIRVQAERATLSVKVSESILRSGGFREDQPPAGGWDELAIELFRFQVQAIAPYSRWCAARGVKIESVAEPFQIPAVPSDAFKRLGLFAGEDQDVAREFLSSGTTDPTRRSRACFSAEGLGLMDVAIDTRARRMLFPDGRSTRILALAPAPSTDSARIMAHGIERLITQFGLPGSRFLIGPRGLDLDEVVAELEGSARDRVPVTLAGATSALAMVIERLRDQGRPVELPAGSRSMDAGGVKRGSTRVDRDTLGRDLEHWLAISPGRAVNLLGMTELASQFYDDSIAASFEARAASRGKVPAPWCRTWVVDPESLELLPVGAVGVLKHLDLANVERPSSILTDDLGRAFEDGSFEVLDRAVGADPRGCSLDSEEWLIRSAPP